MAADPQFIKYVDEHQEELIERLAQAVGIPSYVDFSPPFQGSIANDPECQETWRKLSRQLHILMAQADSIDTSKMSKPWRNGWSSNSPRLGPPSRNDLSALTH